MHAPSFAAERLRQGMARVVDWVLPPQCLSCGAICERHGGLCPDCWEEADFLGPPWCFCCGLPFELQMPEGALCGACLREPPVFTRARAAMAYDDLSRRMILGLKYGDRADMTPAFAEWMGRAGQDLIREADWIAPVPLHWMRLFRRRFNQAADLARLVARDHGRPYAPDLLLRRKRKPSQAGLSASARRRNVQGVFALNPRWKGTVKGSRVLLVDDVFTTGATVTACAKALKRSGVAAVDVLTLARVVRSVGGS